jgi:hypothetical protein
MTNTEKVLWASIIVAIVCLPGCAPLEPGPDPGPSPKPVTPPTPTQTACRLNYVVPTGWIIVNYKAGCINPPGYITVYNEVVIEQFSVMPIGSVLSICFGQAAPKGWSISGPNNDPTVCPREPGDPTQGPTASYMKRLS